MSQRAQAYRHHFNTLASEWESMVPEARELRDHMVRFGLKSGDRVMDIGAGTGRLTRVLVNVVGVDGCVDAVDVSDNMMRRAKSNLRQNFDNLPQQCLTLPW